jgi:hypothetical protein
MHRVKTAIALLGAVALSGCMSTRGGQDIECAGFDRFAKPMELGSIIEAIEFDPGLPGSDSGRVPAAAGSFDLRAAKPIDDLFEPALTGDLDNLAALSEARGNILLLSGGGQWGAYGAGLFLGLVCPADTVTDRHNGALPCHDAAGKIDPHALNFAKLDELEITTITGVSTGGLQATLLMIVLDTGRQNEIRAAALGQLVKSYLPAKQSDLVDHTGFVRAVFKGSVAGTNPLRRQVASAYDDKREVTPKRSFVEELYLGMDTARVDALIGIVDASDSRFKSVNINEMLKAIRSEDAGKEASIARSSRCMQAASLASSAMPVFHQQLRVVESESARTDQERPPSTLFDGGVRRSVFAEYVGAKAAQAVNVAPAIHAYGLASANLIAKRSEFLDKEAQLAKLLGQSDLRGLNVAENDKAALNVLIEQTTAQTHVANDALATATRVELDARVRITALRVRAAALPTIFVLRNGPTTRGDDPEVDAIKSAQPQAMRAYDILVNELEVGSIAALRLQNPLGEVFLSTAEGIATNDVENFRPLCPKRKEMMFDPTFMRCLLLTGAQRAQQVNGPWWTLPFGETVKTPVAENAD